MNKRHKNKLQTSMSHVCGKHCYKKKMFAKFGAKYYLQAAGFVEH